MTANNRNVAIESAITAGVRFFFVLLEGVADGMDMVNHLQFITRSMLPPNAPPNTELDLNSVIARPDGAVAVDARVRVAAQAPQDPFLRRLR